MSAATARARRRKMPPIAIDNGRPIRSRAAQMALWTVAAAACGAALVAGLYFNFLEVNWHAFDLKTWWDGGMGVFHSASWVLYRHGIRDIGEPALATIAVKTLLAKRRTWGKRAGPAGVAIRVALVAAATVGLAAGAIWLIDFGLPQAGWHQPAWMVKVSAEQLILGVVIGQIVHRIWAPAGAAIQGHYIDKAVARSKVTGRIPAWVRRPVAPPQVRERFVWQRSQRAPAPVISIADAKSRAGRAAVLGPPAWRIRAARARDAIVAVVAAYLVVTGFIAHYWIGTGHTFPFLAP